MKNENLFHWSFACVSFVLHVWCLSEHSVHYYDECRSTPLYTYSNNVEHDWATIFSKPIIYAEKMFLLKLWFDNENGKNIPMIFGGNPHSYQFHKNDTRFNQRTIYEFNLLPINSDKAAVICR